MTYKFISNINCTAISLKLVMFNRIVTAQSYSVVCSGGFYKTDDDKCTPCSAVNTYVSDSAAVVCSECKAGTVSNKDKSACGM